MDKHENQKEKYKAISSLIEHFKKELIESIIEIVENKFNGEYDMCEYEIDGMDHIWAPNLHDQVIITSITKNGFIEDYDENQYMLKDLNIDQLQSILSGLETMAEKIDKSDNIGQDIEIAIGEYYGACREINKKVTEFVNKRLAAHGEYDFADSDIPRFITYDGGRHREYDIVEVQFEKLFLNSSGVPCLSLDNNVTHYEISRLSPCDKAILAEAILEIDSQSHE